MLLKRIASNSLDKTFLVFGLSQLQNSRVKRILQTACIVCALMLRSVSFVTAFKVTQWSFFEWSGTPVPTTKGLTWLWTKRKRRQKKLEKKDGLRNELLYSFELMYTVSIEYLEILYVYIYYIHIHIMFLILQLLSVLKKRTCENFVLHLA